MGLYSIFKKMTTAQHEKRKMQAQIPKHADQNFRFKRNEFEKFVMGMKQTDRRQVEELFGKDKFKNYFQHGGKSWREIKQDLKKAGSKYDKIRKDTEKEIIKKVTPDKGERRQIVIQRALDKSYEVEGGGSNRAISIETLRQSKGGKALKRIKYNIGNNDAKTSAHEFKTNKKESYISVSDIKKDPVKTSASSADLNKNSIVSIRGISDNKGGSNLPSSGSKIKLTS